MAINLMKKGERVEVPLKRLRVDLRWTPNDASGFDFDLDASTFMLGEGGQIPDERYFVFYNNLQSPDGAVASKGDDLSGEEGEQLTIDLDKVDPRVNEILFTVTIHEAESRRQNFGQVRNSSITISNADTNEEILRYDLEEDFSIETGVEFGRLYRRGGGWRFEAVGRGYPGGLQNFCERYARQFI